MCDVWCVPGGSMHRQRDSASQVDTTIRSRGCISVSEPAPRPSTCQQASPRQPPPAACSSCRRQRPAEARTTGARPMFRPAPGPGSHSRLRCVVLNVLTCAQAMPVASRTLAG